MISRIAIISSLALVVFLRTTVSVAQDRPIELYAKNHQSAVIAQDAGDLSMAEKWHRKNLALVESEPGVPAFVKIQARYFLANTIVMQGRLDDAQAILTEADQLVAATPDVAPIVRAQLLSSWGGLKNRQGAAKQAVETLTSALGFIKQSNVPARLLYATTNVELGRAQRKLGQEQDALKSYATALTAFAEESVTDSNVYVAEAVSEYTVLREKLGVGE
ncbi:MAG: tetratricopeptide repeat protein [Pseudomonadota bacterium]